MDSIFFVMEKETGHQVVAFRQYKDADDYCQENDPERYGVRQWKLWASHAALKVAMDQVAQAGEL